MLVHLLKRLRAEPAFGLVVDPLECQVVRRLRDYPQVREGIADFGAFVEAEAADDAVGHADLDEAILELAGLVLCAHEDRDLVQPDALPFKAFDLLANTARFFGPVPHADHADLVARIRLGPQFLAQPLTVRADQARCGTEDMGGGAIILLQLDDLGAGKILLELQDIGDFRAAPRVDRLVVVAHYADVLAVLREQPQPQVLDLVGVLIFVDEDIFEAVLVLLQHVRILPEDIEHVQQQIAEVAGVQRLQPLLVGSVKLRAAAVGVAFVLHRIKIAGVEPAVLPPVDQPGELACGPTLLVQLRLGNQCLEQPQLVVRVDDREVRLQTDQLRVAAQHLRTDRVEGTEPGHPLHRIADMPIDPFAHFACGLVGKGDAQDFAWPGEPHRHQVRKARGQGRSLPGARTRQHQDGPFRRQHGFALRHVQARGIGRNVRFSGGGGEGIGAIHGDFRTSRERAETRQGRVEAHPHRGTVHGTFR